MKGKPVKYFAELLKTETAVSLADYEHKYWGKYAGITENKYGNGCAYYIGAFTEKELLKAVYERAAEHAEIEIPEENWPVIIRSGENQKKNRVHYVFHYSEEERDIVCPYETVVDLLTGKHYKKGDRIRLSDWDVKILEEK